jgi:hypothetical protein
LENCLINTSYGLIVFPSPVRGSGQGFRSADGREQGRNKNCTETVGRKLDRAAYRVVGRAGKAEGASGLEIKVEMGLEKGRKGCAAQN